MTEKLENWIIIPRQIAYDKRDGKLSASEMFLLFWLRANGNPYGITVTSLKGINEDIFDGKFTISYINKLILSLRSKRYLHYEDRTGCRGSFNVHFGDWILPNKTIRSLDKYFDTGTVRPLKDTNDITKEEVGAEESSESQSIEDAKAKIDELFGRK